MFGWKSNFTKFLEAELQRVRAEAATTIEQLKTAHAEELKRAIDGVAYHRDEIERLRRFLFPGIQPVYDTVRQAGSPGEPQAPPDPDAHLTPFQRMVARDLREQDAEAAKQKEREKNQNHVAESGTAKAVR